MKRITNILAAILVASPAAMAWKTTADSTDVKLYDINVDVDEAAKKLRVRIEMDVEKYSLGADREMIFTPVLLGANGTDSLTLKPIVVAGRNLWYSYLRNGMAGSPQPTIFRAGEKVRAVCDRELPLEDWMAVSSLEMRCETANCCDTPDKLIGPSTDGNVPLALIDLRQPELTPEFVFAPPVDAGPVVLSLEGSAFVTFVVNRTELNPSYMINPQELAKITGSIDKVRRE